MALALLPWPEQVLHAPLKSPDSAGRPRPQGVRHETPGLQEPGPTPIRPSPPSPAAAPGLSPASSSPASPAVAAPPRPKAPGPSRAPSETAPSLFLQTGAFP